MEVYLIIGMSIVEVEVCKDREVLMRRLHSLACEFPSLLEYLDSVSAETLDLRQVREIVSPFYRIIVRQVLI